MDLHIVFGDSAAGSLKVALPYKEQVIQFSDLFSVGPLFHLGDREGLENRENWMKDCFHHDWWKSYKQDFRHTLQRIKEIPDQSNIIIWAGDNAHEQTGLRLAVAFLKNRANTIQWINVTKRARKVFQEKHPGYDAPYLRMGEISPEILRELYSAPQDFQTLTTHQQDQYIQEWQSLSRSKAVLRVWKDNKIQNVGEDYFDEVIVRCAQRLQQKDKYVDSIKAARLIGEVLGHLDQHVGDAFLEYRLRQLIQGGVFRAEGSLEAMRYYNIQLIQ